MKPITIQALRQRTIYGILYCTVMLLLLAADARVACIALPAIGIALWCETFGRSRQPLWFVATVTAYFVLCIGFWLCALESRVAAALCVAWASDTGGYLCGKTIGGQRVFTTLSPGKTYSGYCGGLCFAVCVGMLLGFGAYISAAIGLIGAVGDLVGSAIKRAKGVKDASSLIPGHGGLLDRFDSTLPLGCLLWMSC